MDAFPESPEERQALVERHDRLREELDAAFEQLVEAIPEEGIVLAAKELGLWRRGGLTASENEDFLAIFDLALFGSGEQEGLIASRLREDAAEPKSRAEAIHRSLLDSRFSIFEVVDIVPELGLELHDRIRDERIRVVDPGLAADSAIELNEFLLGRLVELDGFTLTSNCLKLHPELATSFAETTSELFRVTERRDMGLSWLNATVLRGVMHAKHGRPQTPVRSTKVGRNDPCPCESGKKYKKCCGA